MFDTLRARKPRKWYFDNGCSRNMTIYNSFFSTFEDFNGGHVTFTDGNVALVRVGFMG